MKVFRSLLLLLALATTAHAAGGKAEAKDAFRRGMQYYNLGDFAPALAAFKEAYLDFPDPSFLFNIGQCHRQLGHKSDAVLAYRAYLREATAAPNRADVQALVANLEQVMRDEEAAKLTRPQGTVAPADTQPAPAEPAPVVATTPSAHDAPTPVYKKWWLWTAVAVVAVGLGVGLGLGLSGSTHYPSGQFSDGVVHF